MLLFWNIQNINELFPNEIRFRTQRRKEGNIVTVSRNRAKERRRRGLGENPNWMAGMKEEEEDEEENQKEQSRHICTAASPILLRGLKVKTHRLSYDVSIFSLLLLLLLF